jgi:hypothetical protein
LPLCAPASPDIDMVGVEKMRRCGVEKVLTRKPEGPNVIQVQSFLCNHSPLREMDTYSVITNGSMALL